MTAPPAGARIWLCAGVTDMRRGFTGLSAQVAEKLGENPFGGHLFVFRGRRGNQARFRIPIGVCRGRVSLASLVRQAAAPVSADRPQ